MNLGVKKMTEQEIRNRADEIMARSNKITARIKELCETAVEFKDTLPIKEITNMRQESHGLIVEQADLLAELGTYKGIVEWQPEGMAN